MSLVVATFNTRDNRRFNSVYSMFCSLPHLRWLSAGIVLWISCHTKTHTDSVDSRETPKFAASFGETDGKRHQTSHTHTRGALLRGPHLPSFVCYAKNYLRPSRRSRPEQNAQDCAATSHSTAQSSTAQSSSVQTQRQQRKTTQRATLYDSEAIPFRLFGKMRLISMVTTIGTALWLCALSYVSVSAQVMNTTNTAPGSNNTITNGTVTNSSMVSVSPSVAPTAVDRTGVVNTTIAVTMSDLILNNTDLGIVAQALDKVGLLSGVLNSTAAYVGTLFLPTDAAMAALNQTLAAEGRPDYLTMILQDPEWSSHLECFLLTHLVGGQQVFSTDLMDGMILVDAFDTDLTVSLTPSVTINDRSVVVNADQEASNGVLHILDFPIVPSCLTVDILTAAMTNTDFSLLLEFLQLTGVNTTLNSTGPFTVFAPTDEAFLQAGNDTLDRLRSPEIRATATSLLSYHVVPQNILSSNRGYHTTLEGSDVLISESEDGIPLVSDFQFAASLRQGGILLCE